MIVTQRIAATRTRTSDTTQSKTPARPLRSRILRSYPRSAPRSHRRGLRTGRLARALQRHPSGVDEAELYGAWGQERVERPVRRGAGPVAGEREEVVTPSDRLRGEPGERDVQRVRRRLAAAEVDEEPQVVVLVRLEVASLERCRDVAGHEVALPLSVLRGHAGDRTGAREVRHAGAVPAGEHVRLPRDDERSLHLAPPLTRGQ